MSPSYTYLTYLVLGACIAVAIYSLLRYRRIERTGAVVEATILRLTTPENQTYELSHTGYVDMTVPLSMPLPDGSEIETSLVEQFSRSHFRKVGDRLAVVIDPLNPRIVYLPNRQALARAGRSES